MSVATVVVVALLTGNARIVWYLCVTIVRQTCGAALMIAITKSDFGRIHFSRTNLRQCSIRLNYHARIAGISTIFCLGC